MVTTTNRERCEYFCLHCFSFDSKPGLCCNLSKVKLNYISKIFNGAFAKINWFEFIEKFKKNIDDSTEKIKVLTDINDCFGLTELEKEKLYSNFEILSSKPINFFDVNVKADSLIVDKSIKEDKVFMDEITSIMESYYRKRVLMNIEISNLTNKGKVFKNGKHYFCVFVYGCSNTKFVFPTKIENYMIYDGVCNTEYTTDTDKNRYFLEFSINDIKQEYTLFPKQTNNNYIVPQAMLVFDIKQHAIEFRQKYINCILSYFKNYDFNDAIKKLIQEEPDNIVKDESIKSIPEFFYIDNTKNMFIADVSKKDDKTFIHDLLHNLIQKNIRNRFLPEDLDDKKTYFVMLIYGKNKNNMFCFPSSYEKYLLYEGKPFCLYENCNGVIKDNYYINVYINNSPHIFPLSSFESYNQDDNKIRQEILIFDTKEEADEFQKQYIDMISNHFKTTIV